MRNAAKGLIVAGVICMLCLPAFSADSGEADSAAAGSTTRIGIIPVEGEIAPGLGYALQRRVERARQDGMDLILIEVDSPGGRVDVCNQMCETLLRVVRETEGRVRTAAYVKREAISAAAIIALACRQIVMREGTRIGDAQAVFSGAGGMEAAPEKIQT